MSIEIDHYDFMKNYDEEINKETVLIDLLHRADILLSRYEDFTLWRELQCTINTYDEYNTTSYNEIAEYVSKVRVLSDYIGNVAMISRLRELRDETDAKIKSLKSREEESYYLMNMCNFVGKQNNYQQTPLTDTSGINKFIKRKLVSNKGDVYDSYKRMIGIAPPTENDNNTENEKCISCGGDMILLQVSSTIVCTTCGRSKQYQESTLATVSYNDRPLFVSVSGYKRINHFNEWLTQFQAKESTIIHDDVIKAVVNEFKKHRLTMKYVTPDRVQRYLKKLGFNQFYEHKVQIACMISHRKPPYLTIRQEEQLRHMFKLCQQPFDECPSYIKTNPQTRKVRKNFPSYSYILYKFCELLDYDDFISNFKLLKAQKKLEQHDKIWHYICGVLGWNFIPSSSLAIITKKSRLGIADVIHNNTKEQYNE